MMMLPLTLDPQSQGYMQKVVGAKIEEDYVSLHEGLLYMTRDKALRKLRLMGDIIDPPMKQSDTFTLGCLVGCMLPLLLYSVIVVIAGHNVTASQQWPFVWVHFRMAFLCMYNHPPHPSNALPHSNVVALSPPLPRCIFVPLSPPSPTAFL